MPLLRDIKRTVSDDVRVAALPVCYRTSKEFPTMQAFGEMNEKYLALDSHTCTRSDYIVYEYWSVGDFVCDVLYFIFFRQFRGDRGDLFAFTRDCMELGVDYIGTCCGGAV